METFKRKINELTVHDKGSAAIRDSIRLRQTRPFVGKNQGFLVPQKSLFNKIVGDSHLELLFASFLEHSPDVLSWTKNFFAVNFKIDCIDANGDISNYYPDFIVKTDAGHAFIVETKGLEDLDVPLKMARLNEWCEDTNAAQSQILFDYVFVEEYAFTEYAPDTFEALVKSFTTYRAETMQR